MYITHPTLAIDPEKAFRNLERMVRKANKHNLSLRPHVKTHQSVQVAEWLRNFGIEKITVSSAIMARYFASHGWHDILLAFPANPRASGELASLAETCLLTVLVTHPAQIKALGEAARTPVQVLIELDCGYQRSGLPTEDILPLLDLLAAYPMLVFNGFYLHAGHSYRVRRDPQALARIHQHTLQLARQAKRIVADRYPGAMVVAGDTPCCSVLDFFEGLDEITPGNFIFYDLTQQAIGSCQYQDIALAMACPVVDVQPETSTIIIHGGGAHFSKDYLEMPDGQRCYGLVAGIGDLPRWNDPLPGAYLASVSQEHGLLKAPQTLCENLDPGSLVWCYPVHACLAADTMRWMVRIDNCEKIFLMPKE